MKKWITIILAILLLTLSGCDMVMPTPSNGEIEVPFDPENPPKIDFDAPAMSVTVTIEAELELTLSYAEKILEVKTLNTDGEKLLEGIDLVGKRYYEAMTVLLEKAKEQGFLQDGATISMAARELLAGTWTAARQSILLRPIDVFQQKAGITLECELTPEGEYAWKITQTHTNQRDDYDEVICYNAGGMQVMNKYIYDNGDYEEHYYISDESVTWGNDGSYRYYGRMSGASIMYEYDADGTRHTTTSVLNADGQKVWSFNVYSDGATDEAFYQNGTIAHSIYIFADGSSWEYFYEDGELARHIVSSYDGYTIEYFYENGEVVREVETDPEGNVSEKEPNQEAVGPTVTVPPQTAPPETVPDDGSTYEVTYHSNGNIASEKTTWPNGDYLYDTYHENGTASLSAYQMEGVYAEKRYDENGKELSYYCLDSDGSEYRETYENGVIVSTSSTDANGDYFELHYDENGNKLSYYSLDPDGSEYRETYENGVRVSTSSTEANGDYLNITYYANGSLESSVSYQDGCYSEDYYREDGSRISSYCKDSESEIKWTFDENDEMTSYEEKFADGAWFLDTYENGKHVLSKGYGSDGLYWENVYDENGMLIKTIREVAPGQFVEDIIDPNEIPSSGT